MQLNRATSNSVDWHSPLFQGEGEFPWISHYFYSHLISDILNLVILNSPLFQTHPSFPRLKNKPIISNLMTLMDKPGGEGVFGMPSQKISESRHHHSNNRPTIFHLVNHCSFLHFLLMIWGSASHLSVFWLLLFCKVCLFAFLFSG